MEEQTAPRIDRRPIPQSQRMVSMLAISVDPPAVAPPSADARSIALLRRARERGVTTFDVARARFTDRAERMLATAFPSPDPELGVILGRSVDTLASERDLHGNPLGAPDLPGLLRESLAQSRRRLGPLAVSIVEWDSTSGETTTAEADPPMPPPWDVLGADLAWSIRIPSRINSLPGVGAIRPLYTGELSLLNDQVVRLFEQAEGGPSSALIARDPFSGGRLDGSRFAAASVPGGPGGRPVDVRRLHQEFDPILRLGFLTKHRRRTLSQAALRFVVAWPWVATVVIPLPTPERFDEVLGFGSSPPLDTEEWAQLGFVK